MAELGYDYLYLSDECAQDVFSLWSDTWSVGEPVGLPAFDQNENVLSVSDVLLSSTNLPFDDGQQDCNQREGITGWQSNLCQTDIFGDSIALSVATEAKSNELLPEIMEMDWLSDQAESLSPTISAVSPSDLCQAVSDNCSDVELKQFESNQTNVYPVHEQTVAASSMDAPAVVYQNVPHGSLLPKVSLVRRPSSLDSGCASYSSDEEISVGPGFPHTSTNPSSGRPQRIAARRAEIAAASTSLLSDEEEYDDEGAEENVPCTRKKNIPEVRSSKRSAASDLNKNALNARINRQKKKAYIASLEAQKSRLGGENKRMKSVLSALMTERDDLIEEVNYLRSVLANESMLAGLIRGIDAPNVKLSAAAMKRKNVETDHSYGPSGKVARTSGGGVCLHVRDSQVSLELCHRCSKQAVGEDDCK